MQSGYRVCTIASRLALKRVDIEKMRICSYLPGQWGIV
jgi:hypothetical protein